jgi:hypothetical protein
VLVYASGPSAGLLVTSGAVALPLCARVYAMNSLHSWPWCAWDCEENTKMITSNEN